MKPDPEDPVERIDHELEDLRRRRAERQRARAELGVPCSLEDRLDGLLGLLEARDEDGR